MNADDDRSAVADLLGDTYDGTTSEQRDAIAAAIRAVNERWPLTQTTEGPVDDHDDERREALNGALQVILGDDTDEAIARAVLPARRAWLDAQARLAGAIIAGTILDPSEGVATRARRLNTTRDTVRKALGQ